MCDGTGQSWPIRWSQNGSLRSIGRRLAAVDPAIKADQTMMAWFGAPDVGVWLRSMSFLLAIQRLPLRHLRGLLPTRSLYPRRWPPTQTPSNDPNRSLFILQVLLSGLIAFTLALGKHLPEEGFYHNIGFLIPKFGDHRDSAEKRTTHTIIAHRSESIGPTM